MSFFSFATVKTARSISSKLLAPDVVELLSICIRCSGCVMVSDIYKNICGSIYNHNDVQLLAMSPGNGAFLSRPARPKQFVIFLKKPYSAFGPSDNDIGYVV